MPVTNLNQFTLELEDFQKKVETDGVAFLRLVALQVLQGVIFLPPVDTGRARGNWQVSQGSPIETPLEVTDPAGAGTLSRGTTRLLAIVLGETVWITNNVEYISYLEHGTDRMAAQPMVAPTLARVAAQFDNVEEVPSV